jgi:hypothetical protein
MQSSLGLKNGEQQEEVKQNTTTIRDDANVPQYTSQNKPEATPGQADQHEQPSIQHDQPAIIPIQDAEDQVQVAPMQLQQEQVPSTKEEHEPENMLLGHRAQPEQMPSNFLTHSQ